MMWFHKLSSTIVLFFLLSEVSNARRVRVRPRPIEPQESSDEIPEPELSEEDSQAHSAIQYYNADSQENLPQNRIVLVAPEYNRRYDQQQQLKAREGYNRPHLEGHRSTTPVSRTKDQAAKTPPVQTIRNYSKVNDDGSFTFGYEAADGSFKEETRGTDCVVRGKYGYIDPDGNKREFTYVSGNPCDPNSPDGTESEEDRGGSEEDSRENENVPQNYPQRPIRPIPKRIPTTTNLPPTTIFQNTYSHKSLQKASEEERDQEPIQVLLPQRTGVHPTVQPISQYLSHQQDQQEITIRQKPRVSYTTPAPATPYQPFQSVSITPRPTYRTPIETTRREPPATTYRPGGVKISHSPAYATRHRPESSISSTPNAIASTTRRVPIDFNAEFQKFQKEHNLPVTTTPAPATYKPYKPAERGELPATSNPIYESQLLYDPNSGQYDSALYQQLPQTDGDFQLHHKIQPYVHQLSSPVPQLVSLDHLQQINPIYRRQHQPAPAHLSQQIYESDRENLQVLNSQQLFQQQQELQKQQLHQDRIEAARKASEQHQQQQSHRFQPQLQKPISPQGFYYIQPSESQIDAFLRGHNIPF